MKRGWKIVLICISIGVLWLGVLIGGYYGCGAFADCSCNAWKEYKEISATREIAGFRYYYASTWESRWQDGGGYVVITDFTEEIRDQKRVIIPKELNGRPVVRLGHNSWSMSEFNVSSKKIYLPRSANTIMFPNEKRFLTGNAFFFIQMPPKSLWDSLYDDNYKANCYVADSMYEECLEMDRVMNKEETCFQIANLTYMDGDEVYFIDHYEEGEIIDKPSDPMKEGFQFMGWFKEPECIKECYEKEAYSNPENLITVKYYAFWKPLGG